MIRAFPKIFAVGTDYIREIFEGEVEITEKIDGSQFAFGKIDGEVYMRSKGKQQFAENPDKMFQKAVDYVLSVAHLLKDDTVYYCEYLQKNHHNALVYDRVPKNNLILFGVCDKSQKFISDYESLKKYADELDVETIPLIFKGWIKSPDQLLEMIKQTSVLGKADMEGVVVKNYAKQFLLGGQPMPLMAGKYVSEKFKEVHRESWSGHTCKGKWQMFKESYKSEARWQKAVQHLKENGELENDPKDIGKLLIEIQKDIGQEEKEIIKNFLWKEFCSELMRTATAGFPEWYKEQLLKRGFEEGTEYGVVEGHLKKDGAKVKIIDE
jgi:hypothetical protein